MKKFLRKKYLKIRSEIKDKELKDQKIYNIVLENKQIKKASTILIYVSLKNEVDTYNLIKYFLKFKKVAVPKIENNVMNFYYINSLNDLKIGSFNVLEPTNNKIVTELNNTVCITPGIAFTKDGKRLGYGKGFYDKYFKNHNVYKIGLCYRECLVDNLVIDDNDQKVDEVIYY